MIQQTPHTDKIAIFLDLFFLVIFKSEKGCEKVLQDALYSVRKKNETRDP
jgi:hypothetical protein